MLCRKHGDIYIYIYNQAKKLLTLKLKYLHSVGAYFC